MAYVTITVGGTITSGDTVSLSASSQGLLNSPYSPITTSVYTIQGSDTTASIAVALATAVNSNTQLAYNGVVASVSGSVVTITWPTAVYPAIVWTANTSGANTETYAIAANTINVVTVAQFRNDQAAFQDPNLFSDHSIALYLNIANSTLDGDKWGEIWTLGVELWTAHFLSLDLQAAQAAANGTAPGMNPGIVSAKSIGPASVTYDSNSSDSDAGMWNSTTYGRRYIRFARMVGAGGRQINPQGLFPGNWFPGSSYLPPLWWLPGT